MKPCISPKDASALLDYPLFLDVPTPSEFDEFHIEQAISHPLDQLDPTKVQGWLSGKSACVVVCRGGTRATKAAETLRQAGISNVQVLEGGMLEWEAAGLPAIRSGRSVLPLERQVRIAAGAMNLAGVILGFTVDPRFFYLSGFIGAGLVFAGITDWCGMAILLSKMPWNQRRICSDCTSCSCSSEEKSHT